MQKKKRNKSPFFLSIYYILENLKCASKNRQQKSQIKLNKNWIFFWRANKHIQRLQPRSLMNNSKMRCFLYIYFFVPVGDLHLQKVSGRRMGDRAIERGRVGTKMRSLFFLHWLWWGLPYKVNNFVCQSRNRVSHTYIFYYIHRCFWHLF